MVIDKLQVELYCLVFGICASGFAKLSTLHLYYRMFEQAIRKYILLLDTLVTVWTLAFVFLFIFRCLPITDLWPLAPIITGSVVEPPGPGSLKQTRCINPVIIANAMGWSDVATDTIILGLPIPFIWGLQMPKRRKFAILIIFLLGGL